MSASSSVVSLGLCSHARSFGAALRFLSRVSASGSLSVSVCSYGSGSAFVDFVPLPAVAAVWPAVLSLAFSSDCSPEAGEERFVADWSVGGDNSRAAALEALLAAVGA